MKDFNGKLAVITGGASGIGRAMAARLLSEGARVIITDVESDALESTVSELRSTGDAHGMLLDVSDYDSVAAAAERIAAEHGPVHVLCNNAGVGAQEDVPLWDLPLNDWRWTISVNVWGVIHGIKAFVPGMIEHGEAGHIVNTSSGNGGLIVIPNTPIYATSKAAVSAITETLHHQLRSQNSPLRASVLYPGPHVVSSNIFDARRNRPDEFVREVPQAIPPITLEGLKEFFAAGGSEFKTTTPEEVAEDFFTGLVNDDYFMLPANERGDRNIEKRWRAVVDRSDPEPPEL